MITAAQQVGHFRPMYGKAALVLLFVLVCGMTLTTGFADEHGGRGHGRPHHGHYRENRYRGDYQRGYGYGYAQPVYVPAPVYYDVPPPSPGISLFFPLDFRQ